MCEILTKINCPHCHSAKVVKNGKKPYGKQNFICKDCKKQFIQSYNYKGSDISVKTLIINMLLNNIGIRDISLVLGVSLKTVLKQLILFGKKCSIVPTLNHYKSVQIDELWSYVGNKKTGKRWILYAYCPETKEIIGYVIGKRNKKTVKELYKMLKNIEIDEYCTDNWKSFVSVFGKENHKIGKRFTKHIEGVNTSLRAKIDVWCVKQLVFQKKTKIIKRLFY